MGTVLGVGLAETLPLGLVPNAESLAVYAASFFKVGVAMANLNRHDVACIIHYLVKAQFALYALTSV